MSTVSRVLLALFLLIGAARPAAAAVEIYTVSGIRVDASAESAVVAREQALETAQREGLRQLFARLVVEEDLPRLPEVESLPLERFVRSFTVEEEKRSATRYLASVTVRYEPEAVRTLFAEAGVAAVIAPSAPLLVVPELLRGEEVDRWSEDNPWRQAWLANAERNTFLAIRLPLGDLADVVALGEGETAQGEGITRLAARYGTDTIVFARARPQPSGTADAAASDGPRPTLLLSLVPAGGWFTETVEELVAAPPEDGQEEVPWALGVARAKAALERAWKRDNAVRLGTRDTVRVTVPLADLRGWVQIRRKLEAMPEIRSVRIERLSRREAELAIAFVGDRAQLRQALAGRGLDLVLEDGSWQLRPAEAPAGPSAPSSDSSSAS